MKLTVKTMDARNHEFSDLREDLKVGELKAAIAGEVGIAADRQRLIYQGKVMKDEMKLAEYGVGDGKVLHLVRRPPPENRGEPGK